MWKIRSRDGVYIFFFLKNLFFEIAYTFAFLQFSTLTPICGPSNGIFGVDVFYKYIDALFTRKFFTLVSMTGISRSGAKKESFIKFQRTFKFVLKLLNRCDPHISEVVLKGYFQKVIDNSRRRYEDWNKQTPKRTSASKHHSSELSKRRRIAKLAPSEEEMSDGEPAKASEEHQEELIDEGLKPEPFEEIHNNSLDTSTPMASGISTETNNGYLSVAANAEIETNARSDSSLSKIEGTVIENADEINGEETSSDEDSDDEEMNVFFPPTAAIAATVASDVAAKVAAKVSADAANRTLDLIVSICTLPFQNSGRMYVFSSFFNYSYMRKKRCRMFATRSQHGLKKIVNSLTPSQSKRPMGAKKRI